MKKSGFADLVKGSSLYPQEKLLKTKRGSKSLRICVPNEVSLQENRVGLTPAACGILVNNDQEVFVEQGAGKHSNFEDNEYSEAGAQILYSKKEAFEGDVIVKVEPPTLEEIEMMQIFTNEQYLDTNILSLIIIPFLCIYVVVFYVYM